MKRTERIAAGAAALAAAAALTATTPASAAPAPATTPWSTSLETAVASGERWTESGPTPPARDIVVHGTLSNTGDGCYSVQAMYVTDLAPGPAVEQASLCGPGTATVDIQFSTWKPTTSVHLTLCKETEGSTVCAPWQRVG